MHRASAVRYFYGVTRLDQLRTKQAPWSSRGLCYASVTRLMALG